ncbi:PEP-CTERM sorting domain-containing protein [Chamaesiphon sp. VAR_48_metabat_135_sub]|uniref:PEP-CTERM sorting domain-containing protein n=1 Tax=Chamaesiphon sp. VAR_48_metabat_135_sub TaxID=2964699 RepID=UPI00286C0C72|nr:PEP-CTERM sorting domain-containing protein [Chamaesiphon sp. VAR_48_metabat_135_sub]
MKRFLVISGLILGSSLFPVGAIAATFSQIVVYGDSLSDVGIAAAVTRGAVPPYSPFFGNGRFSNGSIWIEYLAAKFGISANNNFAVGGATSGTINTIPFPATGLVGIQKEVNDNVITDPDALYVIWGGANDYLGAGVINPAVTVGNLSSQISTLIGRGAKNILVPNLSNLGKLPLALGAPNAADLDLLTQGHNAGLAASIADLSSFFPSVKLSLLDVNSLFNRVTANPGNFGFDNVTNQCISVNFLCSTPQTYLFWDDIHPTTRGHQLIGDLAFESLQVPEPTTMLGSLLAFGSVVTLKRKIKPSKLKEKELVKVG